MIKWLKRFMCRWDNWHNEDVGGEFGEGCYVATGKCVRCGEQRPDGVRLGYRAQSQIPGDYTPLGWPLRENK
jgi:hypothetical protein